MAYMLFGEADLWEKGRDFVAEVEERALAEGKIPKVSDQLRELQRAKGRALDELYSIIYDKGWWALAFYGRIVQLRRKIDKWQDEFDELWAKYQRLEGPPGPKTWLELFP
ncbi:unnamed protein product [Vitrella brassicaformis CCMP3155]|uniref:Uncharacterized protein n=2 Tax=Vitrella brassicaformis TaxID=1169539 RepID=A0A0G4ERW3_VITBC|nr:unnamed protein product [Vitrella brassicaformis CCMP3155]|mmetsp:Transcript_19868/g.48185  ORF Transcript_19868/g.48185 Transcript_19868/m.48185 type:complete len:110 (+) Transcript_19868:285-614(+)|eukprot:CEM00961.1 unnamed protein product [Vitrella brassicaformis CCMP3155]